MSVLDDIKHTFRSRNNGLMKLIIINLIVFIAANVTAGISKLMDGSGNFVYMVLGLSPDFFTVITHPWTLFTYMFFHMDVFHILFNMLWLYWMGQLFVEFIGSKQLISTYLLGGIAGGILFIIYATLFPASAGGSILIGASAAVMAIVIAIGFLLPNYIVHVFLLGAVKLKYIALASFILSTVIDFYNNTGGKIAHIGGALYGFLFFTLHRKGVDLGKPFDKFFNFFTHRAKMKVAYKRTTSDEDYNSDKRAKEKRTDEILDKIAKSGYDSLNKEEKDFLFKQSGK
ncbi:MAG: rhomboid family intramembrane serine protease [Bacteroidia bacterium]|nr:rhomboid family intramembrane serine protease [Bacteroidia bacterium]